MARNSKGRFMKGHIQHPKGTHISPSTEFKKGHEVPIKWRIEHSEKMQGRPACNKIELDEKEIVELYNKNFSIFYLADKFGCSIRPICRILKEHNIKMRNNGDYLRGKTGELSPRWQGGISFEPYDIRFTNKFKRKIRKRDNQICMMCGIHREKLLRALDVHHINYNKKMTIPQNCISLCRKCHNGLVHGDKNKLKHWIPFFQDIMSKHYGYQYSENSEIILEVNNE